MKSILHSYKHSTSVLKKKKSTTASSNELKNSNEKRAYSHRRRHAGKTVESRCRLVEALVSRNTPLSTVAKTSKNSNNGFKPQKTTIRTSQTHLLTIRSVSSTQVKRLNIALQHTNIRQLNRSRLTLQTRSLRTTFQKSSTTHLNQKKRARHKHTTIIKR